MMQYVPTCIYSLFVLNIVAHFIAWSVNISDYLSKRDYGLANYSFDIVCIDNMFGWKEITGGKCRQLQSIHNFQVTIGSGHDS